jgi:hypothetical protein
MRPSKRMKNVIEKLLSEVGKTPLERGLYVKITQDGYDRLVIEGLGHRRVSVAHYFEQNGDLIADPEIVFFIGYDGNWYAVETTMALIGHREYARFAYRNHHWELTHINAYMQADLSSFAGIWAKNIRAQGWIRMARREECVTTHFARAWE